MLVDLTNDIPLKQIKPVHILQSMSFDDTTDSGLVRRMAAGEEAALGELYAVYGQRMLAYARRITGDSSHAEDVVQEALIAAWKSAPRYRGEGRVIAWLLGIVHNLAFKSLRHRTGPITPAMEQTLDSGETPPEERVQEGDQRRWLRKALELLTPEHREVLELTFYQELSLKEIARVCGCPLGTVKSRLSHARGQLEGLLKRTAPAGEIRK